MATMCDRLRDELFDEYMSESQEQLDMLQHIRYKEASEAIIELIADYNSFKVLLAQQEYELEKALIDYNSQYLLKKEHYLNEGHKSTEAKEHANDDLSDTLLVLEDMKKDISLLKANIHSVEYQLRLKFIQLKKEE